MLLNYKWGRRDKHLFKKSDIELFNTYKECNKTCFAFLFGKHYGYFYARIWRNLNGKNKREYYDYLFGKASWFMDKNETQKSTMMNGEGENVKSFLAQAFVRHAIGEQINKNNELFYKVILEEDNIYELNSLENSINTKKISDEDFQELHELLNLNEKQLTVLKLLYEGFIYKEIAEKMGTSTSYVQNIMGQIKSKITNQNCKRVKEILCYE